MSLQWMEGVQCGVGFMLFGRLCREIKRVTMLFPVRIMNGGVDLIAQPRPIRVIKTKEIPMATIAIGGGDDVNLF